MLQIRERYGVEGAQILVAGSCLAHLQAAADLGAQLHMVCTGRSAHLDARQSLPPGWPPGTRAHASLGELVDCVTAQEAAATPAG
jgi:D-glycero-D-manno-heptose 1,7-bisphosphate phosphatase